MQQKSDNFSMDMAKSLAQSAEGKKLLSLLQSKNPDVIQKAMAAAASGDMNSAKESLAPLLASQEVKKLLQQLGG